MGQKKLCILLLIIIPLLGLSAFDDSHLNRITFINNTGADIWYVFLSPGDSGEWGFDILGSQRTLEDNSLLSFFISYPDYENNFDIMAIDEEGNTFILYDELLSDDRESNIIISGGDLDDENPEISFLEVEIENQTDYEMYYIFISPSDSDMWGVDMMDDEQTLGAYEVLSLLAPYGEGITTYDVLAVDDENDEYQFSFDIDSDYVTADDIFTLPIEYSDLME